MRYKIKSMYVKILSTFVILLLLIIGIKHFDKHTKVVSYAANNVTMAEVLDDMKSTKPDTTVAIMNPIKPQVFNVNDMEIVIEYGFDGYVKYGSDMRIHAKVTNNGEDYEGKFQANIPNINDYNTLYQEDIKVQSGETKEVELNVSLNGMVQEFKYQFLNDKDETIVEKTALINLLMNQESIFIGVLSMEDKGFSYLRKEDTKFFYLNKDNLPSDYLGLKSLDVIMIENFDTTILSKNQHTAIEQWIRDGGSLIIASTNNIKIENSFAQLLDDKLSEQGSNFINYNIDFGNIMIANPGISLSSNKTDSRGNDILNEIFQNSSKLIQQLKIDTKYSESNYNYRLFNLLNLTNGKEVPKVNEYMFLYLLYIIIVGPVIYLILKKKDLRHYIWILVPAIAVIFTGIVYIMGTNTRITKPYVRYLTFTKLQENGEAKEETFFSITSPYNKNYLVKAEGQKQIEVIKNQNVYNDYASKNNDYNKYSTAVMQEDDQTIIKVQQYPAFTPMYFKSSGIIWQDGIYEYDITDTIDQITGSFTNKLGYDLNNAAMMINHVLIPLGDIKNGEISKIDKLEKVNFTTPDSIYTTDIIRKIASEGNVTGIEINRNMSVLESYIESSLSNLSKDNYLIAFADEDTKYGIDKEFHLKGHGTRAIIIPLNVKNIDKDNNIVMPSLDPYTVGEGNYSNVHRYITNNEVDVTYKFNSIDNLISISYSKRGNEEFLADDRPGFRGTIAFYNYKTQKYDEVFISGIKGEVTELSNYIDEKNTLQVKYKASTIHEEDYPSNDVLNTLPTLTAKKEAK